MRKTERLREIFLPNFQTNFQTNLFKFLNFQNFPKVISKYGKLWICPDIKSNLTSSNL